VFDAAAGFGGYRESGFGREGGKEGLYEYVRPRWETLAETTPAEALRREATVHTPGSPLGAIASAGETATAPALVTAEATDDADTSRGYVSGGHASDGDTAPDRVADDASASNDDTAAGLTTNGHTSDGHAQGTDVTDVMAWRTYPPIDRTPKMFIGGKQVRPDSGYSRTVLAPDGRVVGEVGAGNRKDIRNAVEAAHKTSGWATATAHSRAQILYYIAENLSARGEEVAGRLTAMSGTSRAASQSEVEAAIERLFTYAAWADKFEGHVHATPLRGATLAVPEPIGVIGIACDDHYPLLGFVALVAPAIAMGNTVVTIPSERYPLAATDFYQILETSDLPDGVVNIVTGARDTLADVLAAHDDVDAVWYAGSANGARMVEEASAGNIKRTWIVSRPARDWMDPVRGQGPEFLREATQVKNIWVPSGD